ncbi:hypothetical protein [Pseudomonas sp. B392_1p]|uniref:hypothetical protein n=1 Tax=Pseudomonas sp. B392_1p TaxID=3457507 RepID=UPI003FD0CCE1
MRPQKLPDRLLERLWMKMAEMYGHRWTSSFGEKADPAGAWSSSLKGLNGQQLAHGLNAVAHKGDEWPPSAPAFRAMCLNPAPETLGLPAVDDAFHRALTGSYRNKVVRAAANATGIFDLRHGRTEDAALRRRFQSTYLIMVQRWCDGLPLDAPVQAAIGHDSQKTVAELADEQAEQLLQARIAKQGIPQCGQAAREALLASLSIRRGGQVHV